MDMQENVDVLRTEVDDFIDLVRKKGKISIVEAAKILNIHPSTLRKRMKKLKILFGRDIQ